MQRTNNRKNNELRNIKFTRNFTKNAAGSVLAEFGDTKVIVTATVEEKLPRWMKEGNGKGWLTAEYSLLPASTNTRVSRDRGTTISGRTQEIQRLIGRSLRAAIDLEKLGERTITIDADVIQADGGTRTASITGGFVALNDACEKLVKEGLLTESPITEPVAAISAGIINDELLLDLEYIEDSNADVDCNVVMTQSGKIIEFQSTAEGNAFSKQQLDGLFELTSNAIQKIITLQKNA